MVGFLSTCALLLAALPLAALPQAALPQAAAPPRTPPRTQLDDPAAAKSKYDALALRVAAGDTLTSTDWRGLRLAAVVAGVNGDFDWRDADKASRQAFNAGKFDDALKSALSITRHNIASPNGHFDAYVACKRLDRAAGMEKERTILNAIFKSISDSGDGQSAATAYFTVDPSEEYIFMELVLGLSPSGQGLVHTGGHDYDEMKGKDDAGKESTIWFNTDTDMQMTDRALTRH